MHKLFPTCSCRFISGMIVHVLHWILEAKLHLILAADLSFRDLRPGDFFLFSVMLVRVGLLLFKYFQWYWCLRGCSFFTVFSCFGACGVAPFLLFSVALVLVGLLLFTIFRGIGICGVAPFFTV